MADPAAIVYVQLPGETTKTLAGELRWDTHTRVGAFTYSKDFPMKSYLLDPINMQPRPRRETRNDGIYGVLRDSGPDAWGRDQLHRMHGTLDELGLLLHAPEDGAGNISFHPEQRLKAYTLDEIDEVSKGFPPEDTLLGNAIQPTTSMGGAKPKLLAWHDGTFWIAKFPERGDPEFKNAANEHAMLQLAGQCGIEACESHVHRLPDGRLILLVRRFDLFGTPQEYTRLGFASAHTVLGMGNPARDGELKSYPLLRHEARRWTKSEIGPALWRRLAFNALVSNTDDHARNHALIRDTEGWRLSPAFDIVAAPATGPVRLSLQIHEGSVIATPESLVRSAIEMGAEREDAIEALRLMSAKILGGWRELVDGYMNEAAIGPLELAFRLAKEVQMYDFASIPAPSRPRRY